MTDDEYEAASRAYLDACRYEVTVTHLWSGKGASAPHKYITGAFNRAIYSLTANGMPCRADARPLLRECTDDFRADPVLTLTTADNGRFRVTLRRINN